MDRPVNPGTRGERAGKIILVSMPYARYDSDWFSLVPNVNLGRAGACLAARGHRPLSFHFHLDFLPWLSGLPAGMDGKFGKLAAMGVEYFSLDYLFATMLFPDVYSRSLDRISERIAPLGLDTADIDSMRDAAAGFIDECLEKIAPHLENTGTAAFSSSHFQLSASLLLASGIKKIDPGVRIIIGGKDCAGASGMQITGRMPFVDYVGHGECEATLLDMLEGPSGPPAGVLFRKKKGRIGRSEQLPGIDLDEAPHPAYPFDKMPVGADRMILPLELGRGCTWGRCTFCPDKVYQMKCRHRKPDVIAAEIDHYLSVSPDLKRYIILDADMLKDPAGLRRLAGLLEGKGLTFIFGELRAGLLNRGNLKSLMSLGSWGSHFQVGVESFSDGLLHLMNKGVTAIKNVEAIKAAADLGAPLQFNIITSFPRMEKEDLEENLRIMDLISHLLARENIRLYPSEFYLPPDCEIFDREGHYRIRKTKESTFSAAFSDFDMHALGNYPHYLAFDNQEEQMKMSATLRAKIEEIGRMSPGENGLTMIKDGGEIVLERRREGRTRTWPLSSPAGAIYAAAAAGTRDVNEACREAGIDIKEGLALLEEMERDGLLLFSKDRSSYLSLAQDASAAG